VNSQIKEVINIPVHNLGSPLHSHSTNKNKTKRNEKTKQKYDKVSRWLSYLKRERQKEIEKGSEAGE